MTTPLMPLTDYFLEKINLVADHYGAEKALYYLNALCDYAFYNIFPQDVFLKHRLSFRKDTLIIDTYKEQCFSAIKTVPNGRILELKVKGLTPEEIAPQVNLASSTVRRRLRDIMNQSAINSVIIE